VLQTRAGKTTFFNHSVLLPLEGELSRPRVHIFVSLKQVSDSDASIVNYIVKDFEILGLPELAAAATPLLKSGRCLLLLDGLDKVTSAKRDAIIGEIIELSQRYRENQFVVSCRSAAYDYWFDRFTDMEVADFVMIRLQNIYYVARPVWAG
jgi:predicted NACHT family NTPase